MSTTAENSAPGDALVARAAAVASNDSTSHDDALAIVTATVSPSLPGSSETPVTVGSVLREGREKLGLSPGDIANRLRMGIKQVIALENSDYTSVPTGTFLRGFVRNYAKAVALNAAEVVALLESTHGNAVAVKASHIVVPSQQNIQVPMPGSKLSLPNIRHFGVGFEAGSAGPRVRRVGRDEDMQQLRGANAVDDLDARGLLPQRARRSRQGFAG